MTTEDIHTICLKYNIKNYTINEDLSIDVVGDVDLYCFDLKELPLKFRNVSGWFNCSFNILTTLKGSPSYVGGYFVCSNNNLTSLDGAPSSVGGSFHCHYNPLESLKGIPLNLKENLLYLPEHFTYSDYLKYCKVVERDFKFKKILNYK